MNSPTFKNDEEYEDDDYDEDDEYIEELEIDKEDEHLDIEIDSSIETQTSDNEDVDELMGTMMDILSQISDEK